uniref:Uncharacterized protein n=1 Tax=Myoviridae sp. ctWb16 TaxID=2827690 RepID=A0A8S5T1M4_9CAUD|nr:MAG TPA: hypothetical protein [Myoviridae sp. ctWb16]DAV17856.1 MAG TPA: hypothetical protein [Caudoviricetes sp.]
MTDKYKYIPLYENGYDEYVLPKKIHKELLPHSKFKWGMNKYRYYEHNGQIVIERWFTLLFILWIIVMFIPSILINGVPQTVEEIKTSIKHIFNAPYMYDYIQRKFYTGKLNPTYEKFMKHAKLIKKGKENENA